MSEQTASLNYVSVDYVDCNEILRYWTYSNVKFYLFSFFDTLYTLGGYITNNIVICILHDILI